MKRPGTTDPREVAAAVADLIETQPELHQQEFWLSTSEGGPDVTAEELRAGTGRCGTAGCVAGWAALLTLPGGAVFNEGGGSFTCGGNEEITVGAAGEAALGLSPGDADWLFAVERTRRQVLAALRSLVGGGSMARPLSAGHEESAP
jgi:hypothetical protein